MVFFLSVASFSYGFWLFRLFLVLWEPLCHGVLKRVHSRHVYSDLIFCFKFQTACIIHFLRPNLTHVVTQTGRGSTSGGCRHAGLRWPRRRVLEETELSCTAQGQLCANSVCRHRLQQTGGNGPREQPVCRSRKSRIRRPRKCRIFKPLMNSVPVGVSIVLLLMVINSLTASSTSIHQGSWRRYVLLNEVTYLLLCG